MLDSTREPSADLETNNDMLTEDTEVIYKLPFSLRHARFGVLLVFAEDRLRS
jgi:hypothetical protein